jgi:predicted secreted protein
MLVGHPLQSLQRRCVKFGMWHVVRNRAAAGFIAACRTICLLQAEQDWRGFRARLIAGEGATVDTSDDASLQLVSVTCWCIHLVVRVATVYTIG